MPGRLPTYAPAVTEPEPEPTTFSLRSALLDPESFIVVAYDVPRGNCATYFPEANALVPLDSVADRSNTPTSKSVIVRIRTRNPS